MTDFRALCAELIHLDDEQPSDYADWKRRWNAVANRARAALAEPEPAALPDDYIDPEHSGADRELLETFYTACRGEGGTADEIHLRGLHVVLARWGRSAPQPVPVSERLPDASDPSECRMPDGACWWFDPCGDGGWYFDTYQGNYTHWLPASALPLPQPS
jgi:hypothetical protein